MDVSLGLFHPIKTMFTCQRHSSPGYVSMSPVKKIEILWYTSLYPLNEESSPLFLLFTFFVRYSLLYVNCHHKYLEKESFGDCSSISRLQLQRTTLCQKRIRRKNKRHWHKRNNYNLIKNIYLDLKRPLNLFDFIFIS